MPTELCLVYWLTNYILLLLTGQQNVNYFLFNDDEVDEDDDLPKQSGLRKRVAGTMMEVKAEFRKKKRNGEDTINTKVKD